MRVVVTGGRRYSNRAVVFGALDSLLKEHGALEVATGGATGADWLAEQWCFENGITPMVFRVTDDEWKRLKNRAGPIRNKRMLKTFRPELVLAFPGGAGTKNCCDTAAKMGISVQFDTAIGDRIGVVVHSNEEQFLPGFKNK